MSGLANIISKKFSQKKSKSDSISNKDRAVAAMKAKKKKPKKSIAQQINFGGKNKS